MSLFKNVKIGLVGSIIVNNHIEVPHYLKGFFGDGVVLQLRDDLHHDGHVNHLK